MSKNVFLLPGEAHYAKEPTIISTLLGSCVALVLYDSIRKFGGMNHFMLPTAETSNSGLAPGKYGDKAIPNLIRVASMSGSQLSDLTARLYGGGKVVGHLASAGAMDIGDRNIQLAEQLCRDNGLQVVDGDVAGTSGRKIFFNVEDGTVKVNRINESKFNRETTGQREKLKGRKIRVLVVDGSQVVRRLLRSGIDASPDMEVCGEAENPYKAREQVLQLDPDVLCLDIIMPRMDGLTFLGKIMRYKPIPTVIVSTIAKQGSAMRRKVLDAGAVDVVDKEELNLYRGLEEMSRMLLPKLRSAALTVVHQRH